jgi:hypothetical protein
MKIFIERPGSLMQIISLTLLLFLTASCNFRWQSEHPQITKGRSLYNKYCLDCHGPDGRGTQELLKQYDNIDLTRINQRRDIDEFPVIEIARYIDGRQHFKEFGPRPMPMWGVDMMTLEHQYNPDTARSNLGAIISYLIKLQEYE